MLNIPLTILYVDNHLDDSTLFIDAIKTIDSTIIYYTSFNGKDALEKLLNKIIVPDIIFSGINIPVMNGLEFLTEIKMNRNLKHIPVIILTTTTDVETLTKAQYIGATDFLLKPITIDLLKKTILGIPPVNHS